MTHQRRLNNGIRIVMEEMPTYRSVSIGVWVRVGSMYENRANNGMAHVIEHMLFKGTSRRTAADIANEMTAIGGNMDAFTCKDCTLSLIHIYLAHSLSLHRARKAWFISPNWTRNVSTVWKMSRCV